MSDPELRNTDVDWDAWPVDAYLSEVYRDLHPSDEAVIEHHSAFYRTLPAGSVDRSLELGGGPNLYPLMLAAAVSRAIDVVEPSAASRAYVEGQLTTGADPTWDSFYRRCQDLQPALPATLAMALSRVRVYAGTAADLPAGRYGLVSMHFVAESCTEDIDEFRAVCHVFADSVRRGGYLAAAFMENMGRYRIGDGPQWPGCPVDATAVAEAFAPVVTELAASRVDFDTTGPDYGYTGMVLLTATR